MTRESMRPAMQRQRLAYVLEDFLTPTTTFITQEVQYLYRQGYDIRVYVAGRCVESDIDPAVNTLLNIAWFSRPLPIREVLVSHLLALQLAPSRYGGCLWQIVRSTWRRPSQSLRALRHFLEGIYLGQRMHEQGTRWLHAHFAGRAATVAWTIWRVYRLPYSVTTHAYDLFVDTQPEGSTPLTPAPGKPGHARSLLHVKLDEAQTIVTISDFNVRYLTDCLGIDNRNIQVLRCGIDTSQFHRQHTPRHPTHATILSVGQLVEKKGHDILLQACAYLRDWGYSFQCNIVGDGPRMQALLGLRETLGLADCVRLCGRIHHSELPHYHREADVFALACVQGQNGNMDGIPVALMEAMAVGIPVVTTSLSSIPELVESEHTGLLAEPGDPQAMAMHIKRLLDDPTLREQLGGRGREQVRQHYDQATNLPRIATILCTAMEKAVVMSQQERI